MTESLFSRTATDVLAIGVGSLGCHVSKAGAESGDEPPCAAWAAVHTDPAELIATGLEQKLLIKLPDGLFSTARVLHFLKENEALAANLAAGRSTALLVGALGESHAATILAALGRFLHEAGLFVCLLAAEPFPFQSAPRTPAAHAAAHGQPTAGLPVPLGADLFVSLPTPLLAAGLPDDCPLPRFVASAEKRLLAATQALAGAFNHPLHLSADDLRRALKGHQPALGLGVARGPRAPLEALDAALETLRASPRAGDLTNACLVAALAAAHELSLADAEAVSSSLQAVVARGEMNASAPSPALLAFSAQSHLGDEALCLLLARPGASANVVSIGAELLTTKTQRHKGTQRTD